MGRHEGRKEGHEGDCGQQGPRDGERHDGGDIGGSGSQSSCQEQRTDETRPTVKRSKPRQHQPSNVRQEFETEVGDSKDAKIAIRLTEEEWDREIEKERDGSRRRKRRAQGNNKKPVTSTGLIHDLNSFLDLPFEL